MWVGTGQAAISRSARSCGRTRRWNDDVTPARARERLSLFGHIGDSYEWRITISEKRRYHSVAGNCI